MGQDCGKETGVTEDMVRAGLDVLWIRDYSFDDPAGLVTDVYAAMDRARANAESKKPEGVHADQRELLRSS